jgi:hypothetical protein
MENLKAHWKMKAKEELHNFCQNTNEAEEKDILKGTT